MDEPYPFLPNDKHADTSRYHNTGERKKSLGTEEDNILDRVDKFLIGLDVLYQAEVNQYDEYFNEKKQNILQEIHTLKGSLNNQSQVSNTNSMVLGTLNKYCAMGGIQQSALYVKRKFKTGLVQRKLPHQNSCNYGYVNNFAVKDSKFERSPSLKQKIMELKKDK